MDAAHHPTFITRTVFGSAAILAAAFFMFQPSVAQGQEMEPHAYSATPVDTNFLIANYLRTTGSVSLDPSLPITGVKAAINTGTLAYDRSFGLLGTTASAAIAVPYFQGEVSGQVFTEGKQVTRSGLGDVHLRLTDNFIGNPAVSAKGFAERTPTTTVGASLIVAAPTGDYDSSRLINIGSNRWAFKPDIGLSQPIGDWFVDLAAGLWLFTDNRDFYNGHTRSQAPLPVLQAHVGYNFRPGLWLATDGIYYWGGGIRVDGVSSNDTESVSRFGLSLSVPITDELSAKFAWSTWLSARNGGTFETVGVSLQYRWFDD